MKWPRISVGRAFLTVALACTLSAGCTSIPEPIESVTVRGADFEVMKVLNAEEVAEFQRQWQGKVIVDTRFDLSVGRHFKLDVRHRESVTRLLYMTTGHVTVLATTRSPVYRVGEVRAFNRLLGAAP